MTRRFRDIYSLLTTSVFYLILVAVTTTTPIQGFVTTHPSVTVTTAATGQRRQRRDSRHLYLLATKDDSNRRTSLSHDEVARYSRHLVLADVGVKGQERLRDAAILVIGAGGLGSPALLYLAAAGVGHVGIVDADVVDASNLQRQVIHGTSTVGRSKCESAAQRMQDLNPHVQVRLYQEEFTSATALRILGDGFSPQKSYDVVIDGSDNFPTKYLIK